MCRSPSNDMLESPHWMLILVLKKKEPIFFFFLHCCCVDFPMLAVWWGFATSIQRIFVRVYEQEQGYIFENFSNHFKRCNNSQGYYLARCHQVCTSPSGGWHMVTWLSGSLHWPLGQVHSTIWRSWHSGKWYPLLNNHDNNGFKNLFQPSCAQV